MFIRTARTTALALTAALALSSAITSCSTSDTDSNANITDTADTGSAWGQTAYPRAASATVPAEISDNAAKWANKAADTCTDVTGDLIMATIAVRSGYVLSDRTATGGYGYASMPTAQWDRFAVAYDETTGAKVPDRKPRQDNLADATMATAADLCEGFTIADRVSDEGVEGARIDLALAATYMGETNLHDRGLPTDRNSTIDAPIGDFIGSTVATVTALATP